MGEKNDVFAVARIRVKEKSLLTDADVNTMVGMKNEQAVLTYLRDKGWGTAGSDEDAETMLNAEEAKASALMKELNVGDDVFEVLSYPDMFHNLKTAIKEVCIAHEHPAAFYQGLALSREEMVAIIREKAYERLPEYMREAAKEAYEVMLVNRDGQMCDVICDRACLDAMEKAAETSPHEILRQYEGSTVAVTNIRIAVRASRTGKNLDFLKKALAPCQSYDVKAMAVAASENTSALLDFLEDNGFGEAAEALRTSDSAFEQWCDNRLIRSIRSQKTNPFTLGPVVAYYLARLNEIKTARIILTAKANDLPEKAIRERVREMYV